jgi:ABC-type sulfate transport system substrate-binding protein
MIVDSNVTPGERPLAREFVEYLLSDAGQRAFTCYHLRPADLEGQQISEILQPFTVDDLGGWSKAHTLLVEGLWQTEIEPHLQLESTPTVFGAGE